MTSPRTLVLSLLLLLCGCSPEAKTVVEGNRHIESSTIGRLSSGNGDDRIFYVLHDKDTGADYLAVIDAGIIKLEPLPIKPVENP